MGEPGLELVDFGAPGRSHRFRILCLGRDADPELLRAETLPFPPQCEGLLGHIDHQLRPLQLAVGLLHIHRDSVGDPAKVLFSLNELCS